MRRVATIAVAVAALTAGAPSAAAASTPDQEQRMRRVVESFRGSIDYPGLVAGVWKRGGGSFTTAVGEGDLDSGRPIGVRDRFRIGSVTKTLTATLVLQLVERGRLHLKDPVSEYYRGVPFGDRITIRMLLNHTSGIADGPGNWAMGGGTHKLPVKADIRKAIGKEAGDSVTVRLDERLAR